MKNIRIREMNDDERPVEKMIKKGVKYLNNSELLAILIRTGSRNDSAISLSTKILAKTDKGIRGLVDMTIEDLCMIEGIGPTKATIIKAALELGSRVSGYIPKNYKIKTNGTYILFIWKR